jgi:hypothetical protein
MPSPAYNQQLLSLACCPRQSPQQICTQQHFKTYKCFSQGRQMLLHLVDFRSNLGQNPESR